MPGEMGQDRFQRRLTRELDILGDQPSPVLAPEIQPVLVVEGERPELLRIGLENRFSATLSLGAVAGEYYYAFLWNPAGSGMLVILEQFCITNLSTNAYIDFGVANLTWKASLGARASYSLDTRLPQNPLGRPGVAEPLVGTDPATGGVAAFGRIGQPQFHALAYHINYVIAPNTGFGLFDPFVNEDFCGYFWWRERRARDGELTGT